MVSDRQLSRLFREFDRKGIMTVSAAKAGMDAKTARKYIKNRPKSPEELQVKHTWRTRPDPLASIWDQALRMLEDAPDLEATTIFEHLLAGSEGTLQESHLRTFQRRVKEWRISHGPDKEVFFPQVKIPGEVMQLDWTHAKELNVSIQGKPLDHLLCHVVLPYSNWEWASRCLSESFLSLRQGLQEGLFRLGKAPKILQVDNSSTATHQIGPGRERTFNAEFLSLLEYYGMSPRTINIRCPNENGTIESLNGHLKRRLKQGLILRGSCDFSSEDSYDQFVHDILDRANSARSQKTDKELTFMKSLPPTRLSEYDELYCRVQSNSIIRVKKKAYSVPARLIGSKIKVEVYESELKIHLSRDHIMSLPRVRGDRRAVIDFRHVINHLIRKPGAFANYRYREELYPSPTYRKAHDRLVEDHGQRRGEKEYLHLLKLTAECSPEIALENAGTGLEMLLSEALIQADPLRVDSLRRLLGREPQCEIPEMDLATDLKSYDQLLESQKEVCYVA